MAYNSTNIIKPKESFNSDGQQFHQDQHTVQTFFWFVDIGRIVNHHC
jgi:hypothetical protein